MNMECPYCRGRGKVLKTCSECNASGHVHYWSERRGTVRTSCPYCKGKGMLETDCSACKGTGRLAA